MNTPHIPVLDIARLDDPATLCALDRNWAEFRARRAAGDYADLGEEVQLAHYAL